MASADFFTRLVALNAVGPNNLQPPSSEGNGGVSMVYECPSCYATHDFESAAVECCPPSQKWRCDSCQKVYYDEPYRDGAHAKWDAKALGGLPVWVIALDGTPLEKPSNA